MAVARRGKTAKPAVKADKADKANKAEKIGKTRVLVVEARFYDDISEALLKGASAVLNEAGASFDVLTVRGALEIPTTIAFAVDAAQRKKKPYDAAVALGCVIQGDTFHFDIVAMQSARALIDLSVAQHFPIGNGILTVDNEAQAWARATFGEGNKGGEAARAALALVQLKRRVAKA
jgi:6,7-dimethyl-8-ribityllumazine synthase